MMVTEATETCEWLIIYIKSYFSNLHLLARYVSVETFSFSRLGVGCGADILILWKLTWFETLAEVLESETARELEMDFYIGMWNVWTV